MTKRRPGYHDLFAQIPDAVWNALAADADAHGESIARRLTFLLSKQYRIAKERLPAPKRSGRRPKTA